MVNEEDIVQIVVFWIGVLVQKFIESELVKLFNMEEIFYKCLIGQDEVVKVVFKVICCVCVGLKNFNCLIVSFIFFGFIGVGKIEFIKVLVIYFFGSEEVMICFDMLEFMECYMVSKLIGLFLGYVGFNEGGQFIEVVCCWFYIVVFFDEIEKVYFDVFNLLLQFLEDGCLIDFKGCMVDFKNILIIMILNIGLKVIEKGGGGFGFEFFGESVEEFQYICICFLVNEEFKQYFWFEFFNCFDEIIVFCQFNCDEVKEIVEIMFKEVFGCMGEKGIIFIVFDVFKECLVEEGYNFVYGVCLLCWVVMCFFEDFFVEEVLLGWIKDGDYVEVDVDENKKVVVCYKGQVDMVL